MLKTWTKIGPVGTCLIFLYILTFTIPHLEKFGAAPRLLHIPDTRTGFPILPSNAYINTRFDGQGDLPSFTKPPQRIVGMIMAGRQEFVSILNCYLVRNLVRNGGWLDEVQWIIRTKDESDKSYLRNLVASTPEYTSWELAPGEFDYRNSYGRIQNNTIYIKIDDDVVFFEDHTIRAIVRRLVENPQYFAVSANIINQPAFAWVHYHLGVALPFAAEASPPQTYLDPSTADNWRPSRLPPWTGPADFDFTPNETYTPPFPRHRWLPLPSTHPLSRTPLGALLGPSSQNQYTPNATAYRSWPMAAQQHSSFLTHLENGELWRYKLDSWNYRFDRLTINFLAFRGEDVLKWGPVTGSDEQWLTVTAPRKSGREVVVDGTSVVVHFGFRRQLNAGLGATDLRERFEALAGEVVCGRRMGE